MYIKTKCKNLRLGKSAGERERNSFNWDLEVMEFNCVTIKNPRQRRVTLLVFNNGKIKFKRVYLPNDTIVLLLLPSPIMTCNCKLIEADLF